MSAQAELSNTTSNFCSIAFTHPFHFCLSAFLFPLFFVKRKLYQILSHTKTHTDLDTSITHSEIKKAKPALCCCCCLLFLLSSIICLPCVCGKIWAKSIRTTAVDCVEKKAKCNQFRSKLMGNFRITKYIHMLCYENTRAHARTQLNLKNVLQLKTQQQIIYMCVCVCFSNSIYSLAFAILAHILTCSLFYYHYYHFHFWLLFFVC